MEEFDVIVIGGGSGLIVSSAAAGLGLNTAIIEEGPLGGTCLNRGCIPSKMIIHSADVVELIQRAREFGIYPKGYSIDFKKIITRATSMVDSESHNIEDGIKETENMTLFKQRAQFVGERTLQVGNKKIYGKKVIIAAGTRPRIPEIPGLKDVPYMTSDEALRLQKQPPKLTVIGGGYIATELAHFFGTMGTKITVVQRDKLLVPYEDREVAETFTRLFSEKYSVFTSHTDVEVKSKGDNIILVIAPKDGNGAQKKIESDALLVATGRIPNSDILNPKAAGVDIDKQGYIISNELLETTAKNVWVLGDIAGRFFFKHSANLEAQHVVQNALHGKRVPVDYTAIPHAIFTSPQVAGVGEREQDLVARKADFAVGKHDYIRTGMGAALNDKSGFAKVYADRKTRKLLGCHILGTDASTLIHEAILAMRNGLTADQILGTVHIHPALPEVLQRAIGKIGW